MKNQIFIPTVAKFPADIAKSWEIAKSAGNYNPGLMLVIQGGVKGVTTDAESQAENLASLKDEYGEAPIVVMLSNMPIEEMDFFHNTSLALSHVKAGIDFAKSLPLGGRKMVTFHLNTLIPPKELFQFSATYLVETFDFNIAPAIKKAVEYGKENGVELFLETTPSPEFGDTPVDDEREYRGAKLWELRNPFSFYSDTFVYNFNQMRELGLGICMDICHNRTLHLKAGGNWQENLLREVKELLPTDLVHLNDGSGEFTYQGGVFKEGVTLGNGDITTLPEIIEVLNRKNIPMALEINETDFENRPNTHLSIEYLVRNS